MSQPLDVVLAGTKPFALALFAPLTERTGTRPRIAPDPSQALTLCAASSGLLVVEYGAGWLPALTQLRRQAAGLRIVAALPKGQESAALALGPLGIEVVPWDGQAAQVVAAASQILGRAASAPAAPAPAAAPTRPAVAAPPRPATAPASPVAPRPAAPSTAAPRPVPVAAPAPRPAAPPPVVATPKPAPAAPPPAPPTAAPAPVAAPPAGEPAPLDLFSDLGGTVATPAPGLTPAVDPFAPPAGEPERVAPPPYTGSPAAAEARPSLHWPATAPTEDEAEAALVLYIRGRLGADAPLAAVTRQVVASMSELERQVVTGAAVPFDAAPIHRAAVLRLRVAVALASAPTPPAHVDGAAVQQLLAELDAMLAEVNPLAQGAPPEHQPALEAIRNALVREAVDFSEATHRVTAAGPPPEAQARPAPREPVQGTRVLSVQKGSADDEQEVREGRRRRGPIVLLVLVLLAGAGFHLYRLVNAPVAKPMKTLDGAPAGTRAMITENGTWLVAGAGVKVDAAQLERFREQEAKKGNVLREVTPGRWKIEAATPGGQGAKP